MLVEAWRELPPDGALPDGLIGEQKAGGFRAVVFARPDQVLIQSRQGGDLTPAFRDIASVAAGLAWAGRALRAGGPLPASGRQGLLEASKPTACALGTGCRSWLRVGCMAGAHPRRLRYPRSELFTSRYKTG
jgi:hypothetical protein